MAYELVYTSVPQGIRTGSSGFCTVAYTNGLSASMVLKLEGMSAYKNYFQPNDPNADANPVAYSHYSLLESGQQIHILSRISYYGLDYTMRSNKLAHHVVSLAAECNQRVAGPAAVAAAENFFRTAWQEEPQLFPARKELPAAAESAGVAVMWKQYTGDAGWAGVLAQSFLDSPRKPVFIIFDPLKHTENLTLVNEALRLLPPEKRWQVNFNTYFTMLPAGMSCHWRFCVPGADVLRVARSTPGTLVIDLTSQLPAAGDGELQDMARTGIKKKVPMPVQGSADAPPPPPPGGVKTNVVVPLHSQYGQTQSVQAQIVYNISTPGAGRGKKGLWLIGGALLLAVLLAAGGIWFWLKPKKSSAYDSTYTLSEVDDTPQNSADVVPRSAGEKSSGAPAQQGATPQSEPVPEKTVAKPAAKPGKMAKKSRKNAKADPIRRNRRELWWRVSGKQSNINTGRILRDKESLYAAILSDGREKKQVEVVANAIRESDGITTVFNYSVAAQKDGSVQIGDYKGKWKITALVIKDAAGKEVTVPLYFEYGKCDVPEKMKLGTLQVALYKENISFSFDAVSHERIIRENNPDAAIMLVTAAGSYRLALDRGKFTAEWQNDICSRYFQMQDEIKRVRKLLKKFGKAKLADLQQKIGETLQKKERQLFDRIVAKYPSSTAQQALEMCEKEYAELQRRFEALSKWDNKQIRVQMKIKGKTQLLRRFKSVKVDKNRLNR